MGLQEELECLPPQHNVTIVTDRLLLRAVRASDIHVLHRIRRNEAVMRFMSTGAENSDDPFVSQSYERMKIMIRPGSLSFAVCLKAQLSVSTTSAPGAVIGFLGAFRPPECGYILDEPYWGKGYATEALRAFLANFWEAFPGGLPNVSEKEKNLLRACVYDGNFASERILRKLGFQEIGKEKIESQVHGDIMMTVFQIVRPADNLKAGSVEPPSTPEQEMATP